MGLRSESSKTQSLKKKLKKNKKTRVTNGIIYAIYISLSLAWRPVEQILKLWLILHVNKLIKKQTVAFP